MRRITSPRARLFCVCVRSQWSETVAERSSVGQSRKSRECLKRSRLAIWGESGCSTVPSARVHSTSANAKMNLDLYSRSVWDMKNELRSAIPQTLWIKIRIPIGYPMHSVKQKMDSDYRFHVPYEAKSGSWLAILCTPWSQKRIPIFISMYPMKQNRNSDFDFQVCLKWKTNSDFHFHIPYEAKSELRFWLPSAFEAKNEFRFRLPGMFEAKNEFQFWLSTPYEAKNELRFCFIYTLKGQNEFRFCFICTMECSKWIPILLPRVSVKRNRDSFLTSFFPLDRQS